MRIHEINETNAIAAPPPPPDSSVLLIAGLSAHVVTAAALACCCACCGTGAFLALLLKRRRRLRKVAYQHELSVQQARQVQQVFSLFDTDGSGSIDGKELHLAMRALGLSPSKEETRRISSLYDQDGSSTIDFEEFLQLMKARFAEAGAADPAEATVAHEVEAAEVAETEAVKDAAEDETENDTTEEAAGVVKTPLTRHETVMTPRSATSYLSHLRHLRAASHAHVQPWEENGPGDGGKAGVQASRSAHAEWSSPTEAADEVRQWLKSDGWRTPALGSAETALEQVEQVAEARATDAVGSASSKAKRARMADGC